MSRADGRSPDQLREIRMTRGWLEHAARCHCPTLDDCPLFDEPDRLPERKLVLGGT